MLISTLIPCLSVLEGRIPARHAQRALVSTSNIAVVVVRHMSPWACHSLIVDCAGG